MSQADITYLDLLRKLHRKAVNSNEFRDDRTGTGTVSIFGHQMRFNLAEEFPLLTSKSVHFHSVLFELLWFIKGDTNIKYLLENKVGIWTAWRKGYSFNREMVLIEPRIKQAVSYNGDFTYKGITATYPVDSVEYKLLKTWSGMMKRCYDVSQHNYKYYGGVGVTVAAEWHDPIKFIDDVKKLPHWWYKLNDWNNFNLDKDYYGSNQYSNDTCVWLRKDENSKYSRNTKPITVTDSNGTSSTHLSIVDTANNVGISKTSLLRFLTNGVPSVVKQGNKSFIGYEFKYTELNGKLLRYALIPDGDLGNIYGHQWRNFGATLDKSGFDQLKWVINEIKTNPSSRRLIVSGWNPQDHIVGDAALPSCHTLFQFFVEDGKLSCQLYQRSADVFLGVPFNIASYALLTHLVAYECDLDVGEFVWTGGDVHLYSNHIEQAQLQLCNPQFDAPKLELNINGKSIFNLDGSEVKLINYQQAGKIKAPVAV